MMTLEARMAALTETLGGVLPYRADGCVVLDAEGRALGESCPDSLDTTLVQDFARAELFARAPLTLAERDAAREERDALAEAGKLLLAAKAVKESPGGLIHGADLMADAIDKLRAALALIAPTDPDAQDGRGEGV